MAETASGKINGDPVCYIFAEMQCVFTHVYGVSWAGTVWDFPAAGHDFTGIGLHCSRYAAASRRTGHYGADVSVRFCTGICGGSSASVHVSEQGIELLFSPFRKPFGGSGKKSLSEK